MSSATEGMMRALALMVCLQWAPAAFATEAPSGDQIAKARAAVAGLGEALKAQLSSAIKSSGPIAAVQVCKTVAPALSDEAAKSSGMSVARTALKVRNPDNAPDAFETRVLEDFVAKIAAGADAAKLEHGEIVVEDGKRLFRYMKAIPTAEQPCLVCHGADLKPELKAEIDKLYPSDQATGFKAGDLRGAFTVSEPLGE